MPRPFEGLNQIMDKTKAFSKHSEDTTKLARLRAEHGLTVSDLQRQKQQQELRDKARVNYDDPGMPRLMGGRHPSEQQIQQADAREIQSRSETFDNINQLCISQMERVVENQQAPETLRTHLRTMLQASPEEVRRPGGLLLSINAINAYDALIDSYGSPEEIENTINAYDPLN